MARGLRRNTGPGLYCIELRTERWAELVDWYREILGLRVLVRVIDDGYALLETGETRLAILARQDSGDASRRISLAFEVDDVPKLCGRLLAAGSQVTYPKRDPEGLREANTTDPDGNRLRFFSWPQSR